VRLLQLREFQPDDYPIVAGWWSAYGWSAVPYAILPKLGVVGTLGHEPAAAGWLYMDNSVGVCMLEWLVTNPYCTGKESLRVINAITEHMKSVALSMNYGVMLTTCRQPSLARVHERNGFIKTDEGMIHLVRILEEE